MTEHLAMKAQVRLLLVVSILALALGWAGLRRSNQALERQLAAQPVAGEKAP
jgi:membrane protein implicated in regulation of membrane protease activity